MSVDLAAPIEGARVATDRIVDEIVGGASSPRERRSDWLELVGSGHPAARIAAWRATVARDDAGGRALLMSRGIAPEAFYASLDAHRPIPGAPRPEWAEMVAEMAAAVTAPDPMPWPERVTIADVAGAMGPPGGVDPSLPWPWLPLLAPLFTLAERDVSELLGAAHPGLRRDLRLALVRRLNGLVVRVLLMPLTEADVIAAPPTAIGPNMLASYLHPAGPSGWLGVWRAYPVLARIVAVGILNWRHAARNLLRALQQDRATIAATFGDLGEAIGIALEQGDSHDGGQSVGIVRFARGKLVWKPREAGPARLWEEVITRLAPQLDHPLRAAAMVAGPNHAWQEFIVEAPPENEAGLTAYFWRIGATARLLEALGSVDFHGENLIAAGDQPVLVDLETLLAPVPWPGPAFPAELVAAERYRAMPARSGVITVRADGKSGRIGIEVGGIAPRKPQQSPSAALQLRLDGDQVRFDPGFHRIRTGTALPPVAESEEALTRHYATIETGYCAADAALATLGEAWLPEDAALVSTRHVVRPTRTYARLLGASQEPACLRDGALRDLALERLWCGNYDVPPAAIDFEQDCLRDIDIPTYQAIAGEPDLLFGGKRACGYFAAPALPGTPPRVADLAPLRAVLFARQPIRLPVPAAPGADVAPAALLAGIAELAARIRERAIVAADDATWIGLTWDPRSDGWTLTQVDDSLFNGRAGIGSALARAASVLGDAELGAFAERVLDAARARLRQRLDARAQLPVDLGATLAALADPPLLHSAQAWFETLDPQAAADWAPGLILALDTHPAAAPLVAALQCRLGTVDPEDRIVTESPWSETLPGSRFEAALLAGEGSEADRRLGDALALACAAGSRPVLGPAARAALLPWVSGAPTLAGLRNTAEAALALGEHATARAAAAGLIAARARDERWFPDIYPPDAMFIGAGYGITRVLDLLTRSVAAR